MSTIPIELYKALQKAGIPESEAEAAAKSVWSNNQLATKEDTARIEGELKLVKWMLALVIVVLVVPIVKNFFGG